MLILRYDVLYRGIEMKHNSRLLPLFAGVLAVLMPVQGNAYTYHLNAKSIYEQAKVGNSRYFGLLSRYSRAIDLVDNSGDTAYCMALKDGNMQAARYLASQGANIHHSCAKRLTGKVNPVRTAKSSGTLIDNDTLLYAAGALAVGGGLALALSNSGGGSHHSGGGGGDEPYNPDDPTGNKRIDVFKTEELKKTNLLAGIKAAEAYSKIYKFDENDNLILDDDGKPISHQANSDEPLKKILVGVLDTGVYANNDLAGKIVKTYDANAYNDYSPHENNGVWSRIVRPDFEAYIFKKDDLYYMMHIHRTEDNVPYVEAWSYESSPAGVPVGMTEAQMENVLHENWNISLSDMTFINGGGAGNPGSNMDGMISVDPEDEEWFKSWLSGMHELNHGTHVAGIIAGNKNDIGAHGVAFENAQIYAASWDLEQNMQDAVHKMVDDGVSVINNSWGAATDELDADDTEALAQYTELDESYAYAAKNGVVWVQSTGNMAMHNANFYNGLPKLDLSEYGYDGPGKYEAPYLAVTSLDLSTASKLAPSGKLASYSNWCGSAKGYCLAAPGSQVEATGASASGDVILNGTSMATPAVSGSIALLSGYYPWLSTQNIAWLLLDTANNTGEYANSDKYGRGALDLDRAINKPVGSLSLASDSSFNSLKTVSSNKLALSGVTQKQMLKALPKTVTAFDELHRPFKYETASLVTTTHGSNAHLRQEVSRAATSGKKKVIKDEKTGFSFASSEALDRGGHENLSSMEVVRETDSGSTRFYYAENSQYADSDHVLAPTANPYFAMNNAYGAENTLKLSDSSKLKLSLQTGENGLYDRDTEQDRYSFDERSYAFGAEYSFNLTDYLELATVGGMLYEEDAMLGMNGEGGFGIKDGSTYYMGLKAALHLTPNLSLLAAYYRGYTQGQDTALLALSDMQTESYMIAGEYKLNAKDKIGLSLSSPISVVKGKATFNYASGRDNYSDTIYMNKLTSSLKPAAKEYDLGLYYQGEPKEDLSLLGKVETRFNADGEKGLTDYLGIMGLQYSFPK